MASSKELSSFNSVQPPEWRKNGKDVDGAVYLDGHAFSFPALLTLGQIKLDLFKGLELHLPYKRFGKGPGIEGWERLIDVITRRKVRGVLLQPLHLPDLLRRLRVNHNSPHQETETFRS